MWQAPGMAEIRGERTGEIRAPLDEGYAVAGDIEAAPEGQGSLKKVEVLERDAQSRPTVVQTESDATVKTVKTRLRFSYAPPPRIDWRQEKGDVKSLDGWWTFEDLNDGRTRATYGLSADPGRMLGILLRG